MATIPRHCASCRRPLGLLARRNRFFCSPACRLRAHRLRHAAPAPVDLDRIIDAVEPALAEAALVRGIERAARDDWKAAARTLERRFPSRWSAPRSHVGVEDGETSGAERCRGTREALKGSRNGNRRAWSAWCAPAVSARLPLFVQSSSRPVAGLGVLSRVSESRAACHRLDCGLRRSRT
jgi:hypothetical protein